MSDGGYSRIEKDFLGNERMVHYDASGNMLGASDVIREADGTIRISNESAPSYPKDDLLHVEVIVPSVKAAETNPIRTPVALQNAGMPANKSIMLAIVAASLLTLGALSYFKTRGGAGEATIPAVHEYSTPIPRSEPNYDAPTQHSNPDYLPNDPKPRNDQQPNSAPPVDNGAPDSNMDDNHPRINSTGNAPADITTPKVEHKPKVGSDEPIDLRGDDNGSKDPTKKGPAPTGDPLKDDIH
jgi:hypothetical protein